MKPLQAGKLVSLVRYAYHRVHLALKIVANAWHFHSLSPTGMLITQYCKIDDL